MANSIVAGNSSNGGTAISTDTSGTLNIVTGSGSGSNAITIDASQNVTVANAISVAGNATITGTITATNLFGQGQTWQNVTASRALSTTYTNSTGRPIFVSYSTNPGNASNTPIITINGSISVRGTLGVATGTGAIYVSAMIPSGDTYAITHLAGGTIGTANWNELR
jgi:hypothetical protein